MDFFSLLLIAIGLAMDAFAVSVSNGICSPEDLRGRLALKLGVYFGGFQFIMPVIGYALGSSVKAYIEAVDHWIAFLLLLLIGVNMLAEAYKTKNEHEAACRTLSNKAITLQAVATSIDALAVGISLAILRINIIYAASVIGITAFIISVLGCMLGKRLGSLFRAKAGFLGGVILIGIGVKILIEHTVM